jgi:enterochelin esterase-like enzyme
MNRKAIIILVVILTIKTGNILGQDYALYSNDILSFESVHLQKSINLSLHLPETQPFSASTTKYPITIVFDSQHERTYPQIINAFDLLTSETQIPETVIIGVPFNAQNRLYLTSDRKIEGDSLSGIERMELFLFDELIPHIQNKYNGNEFIVLIGHSRTAFLVNYLTFKRPDQVYIAVSLSGFFNDNPLSINTFFTLLTDSTRFPHKFSYYHTAGSSLEEINYLEQSKSLDEMLKNSSTTVPANVNVVFNETPNANHITNYWVSVPPILIDAFSEYNGILNNWFHDKLHSERISIPIQQFKQDLDQAGKDTGIKLNPSLTHIYSLASHFAFEKNDYNTAIEFFELGLEYFPDYIEFYTEIIEFCKVLKNNDKLKYYMGVLREKAMKSTHLSNPEKEDIIKYLDEN